MQFLAFNCSWFIIWFCCYLLYCDANLQSFEKSYIDQPHFFRKEHTLHRRDISSNCSLQGYEDKLNKSRNVHFFRNDSNPTISLTWSGKDGVILALTTLNMGFMTRPSRLYRSANRGKTFVDISHNLNKDFIRKKNGILVNPADTKHVLLLGYNSPFKRTPITNLYITNDAGATFQKSVASFIIQDTTVKFHPKNKYRILTLARDHSLWMTQDSGITWKKLSTYVLTANWDPLNADILYYTMDPLHHMIKDGIENELYRYNVPQAKATLLAQHVHSFAVQDTYLFLSVQFTGKNGSRVMHVSKNEGHAWNAAQLPMIGKEQFYSLLDMSENMVFVHVDTPGDTGHGNIYTSDERGIVYSLSLERHLYPNNKGITDFYKVNSLPGVYITTQLGLENTVHSRISFDKGGEWHAVAPPPGSKCPRTEKTCDLQIHNTFSASKGVRLPSLPMSSKNTVGLILAHGNLGDGLSIKSPDVYISQDGGYTWSQPAKLKGPHFYGIGDSGGVLFAVSATVELHDTLEFSLDEGQCWHSYKFSDRKIRITGISVEPGETGSDVSVWGWDKSGDGSWLVYTVDFKAVMGPACHSYDYKTWQAHESNTAQNLESGCMLGAKRTFLRRKKGSFCLNGNQLVPSQNIQSCPCQYDDFMCDYGFKRHTDGQCFEDHERRSQYKDICINDTDELITTQGYRKIPGDQCQGGKEPKRTVVNLHKKCAKVQQVDEEFGVDPNQFEKITSSNVIVNKQSHVGVIVFLVIGIVVLVSLLAYILYKKRSSALKVRYTPLSMDDAHEGNRKQNGSLVGTKTIIADEDLVDANGSMSNHHPAAILSYHDDSDDDLIIS